MRIIGGRFRGRPLQGPRTPAVRPTADRLRETLFNVLQHAHGDPVPGARVLDLFAGTGALGLEALSRGAAYALFVDDSVEGRGLVRANVEALGLTGATRLFKRDATRLGPMGPMQPFTVLFADPPYGRGLGERALAAAAGGGWLAAGAIVVLEEGAAAAPRLPAGFALLDERNAGDTRLVVARWSPGAGEGREAEVAGEAEPQDGRHHP